MNSLTKQQRELLDGLVDVAADRQRSGDTWEDVYERLAEMVDALADARVAQFAQGALLAGDVRAHLENTVEQYVLLGHAVHPTDGDPLCAECSKPLSMHLGHSYSCPWQNPAHTATYFRGKDMCTNCGSADHVNHEYVEDVGWVCYGDPREARR